MLSPLLLYLLGLLLAVPVIATIIFTWPRKKKPQEIELNEITSRHARRHARRHPGTIVFAAQTQLEGGGSVAVERPPPAYTRTFRNAPDRLSIPSHSRVTPDSLA